MKIGFDVMGGDYAPKETILGALSYLQDAANQDVHIVLIGDQEVCAPFMATLDGYKDRVSFYHASQVIDMNEHPTKALKEKQDSSIAIGFGLLKASKIDAFISAGNTGAMMVGAMYSVKSVPGVIRPTIATLIPREDGRHNLLADVGANADCKPENLNQFAVLGTLYAKLVLGIEDPKVALLNIGEEEGKGNILAQATYPLLKENNAIHFVGNVEGRDLFSDHANVIVCEGFTGNVVLKMAESIYTIFNNRNVKDEFLNEFNFEGYGGVPILGVNAPVIIGHGISNAKTFKAMITVAEKVVNSGLIDAIKQHFEPLATVTE